MQSKSKYALFGLFAALVCLVGILGRANPTKAQLEDEFVPPSTYDPTRNCRFGGTATGDDPHEIEWLSTFGTGTFIGFTADQPNNTFDQEMLRIIRVVQNRDANGNYINGYTTTPNADHIASIAAGRPGYVWFIGNEMERGESQDDMQPKQYAVAYHNLYQLIKNADPTARISIGGVVQPSPGRLQYLTKVYDEYLRRYGTPLPADLWNTHIYPLPELTRLGGPNDIAGVAIGTDASIGLFVSDDLNVDCTDPTDNVMCYAEHTRMQTFEYQIRAMRQWMADHGYQDKPLVISEMGVLLPWGQGGSCFKDEFGACFDRPRTADFLEESMSWMLNERDLTLGYPKDDYKLIQNWNWFSLHSPGVGFAGNLLTNGYVNKEPGDPTALTDVGRRYKNLIASTPNKPDLFFIQHSETWTINSAGFDEVKIDIKFGNTGHVVSNQPVKVTLFENRDNPRVVTQKTINSDLYGCGMNSAAASFTWVADKIGINEYWIRLDQGNTISELDETNNEVNGIFIVNPPNEPPPTLLYIPMLIGE